MAGLDRYKVNPSAFDRYYDAFLQNSLRGHRFRLRLKSGDAVTGVPTSGSIADPKDPNVAFSLRTGDGHLYRIPFAELDDAASVEPVPGVVRTVDPTTWAAADFVVDIDDGEADRLYLSTDETTVRAQLHEPKSFVDSAPPGTYKFLTIGGRDFLIKKIGRVDGTAVELLVAPE